MPQLIGNEPILGLNRKRKDGGFKVEAYYRE